MDSQPELLFLMRGIDLSELLDAMGLLKPFWGEKEQRRFLEHYLLLLRWLARNGIWRHVEAGAG